MCGPDRGIRRARLRNEAPERRNAAANRDRARLSAILELVSGLEPLTYALRMRCSTS